jgi:hypothetical protein
MTHKSWSERLTCAVVEGIEHGKESADDEHIGIIGEHHFDLISDQIKVKKVVVEDLLDARNRRLGVQKPFIYHISGPGTSAPAPTPTTWLIKDCSEPLDTIRGTFLYRKV